MSIAIPPAVNYQSPLVAVPTIWGRQPREGAKMVAIELLWATMGGASKCVNINMQNNATLEFSQIVTLAVDNSQCGADVTFIFPDTTGTITIPAYEPMVIVPVFSNTTQFFVTAAGSQAQDITRFTIHNSMPPPMSVPLSIEQQTLSNNNISADGATAATLLAAGVSGTLQALNVFRSGPIAGAGTQYWNIVDGNGAIISTGQFSTPAGAGIYVTLINLVQIQVRFNKGLFFSQSGFNVGGAYVINALYRTP